MTTFLKYRNFLIKPSGPGLVAVHEEYTGDDDRRIFHESTEDALLAVIDAYYDEQTKEVFRGLIGLVQLILSRDDLDPYVRLALTSSWRWHDALDIVDSSRGTERVPEPEPEKVPPLL